MARTNTQLLVVRHGKAVDADAFAATGRNDDERPLTEAGARELERVAIGLRSLVERVDLVVPSPLVRARQTAQIVARAYGLTVDSPIDELRPGSALESFSAWVRGQPSYGVVMIVGHSPHLSRLVTWLMSGVDREGIALKKGGACLLDLDDVPDRRAGVLRWLLTPDQIGSGPAGSFTTPP